MTRSAFYNPMKPVEQKYSMKTQNDEPFTQSMKRQHDDELTASSTVTPSSLLSSATSMTIPYPNDVLDQKVEQSARFRIIDLAERCPPVKIRSKRPGIEEEDNEAAIAPRKASYKRISPDFLPVAERACIIDLQHEQQRLELLEYRRENRLALRQAVSLLHVGSTRVQRAQHEQAIPALQEAAKLLGTLQKSVARARSLDLLGQACSNSARWNESVSHLFEAFLIREAELGHTHVDTVDTLKHLGEVFLCSGNARQARNCFAEVFWIHKELFGTDHCCVAAAAHNLANAYDAEDDLRQAETFYRTALDIYHRVGVQDDSPIIQSLLSDLQRVQSS